MELVTRRKENDYERVVDLYVNSSINEIPYINDETTCKLIIVKKGNAITDFGPREIAAPSVVFLSNKDKVSMYGNYQAVTVFFKPSFINDAFDYERLYANEFEDKLGTSIYQDYVIIRDFVIKDGEGIKMVRLTDSAYDKIVDLITKMRNELDVQYDGYWPCRSRLYLIETLFFLNFYYNNQPVMINNDEDMADRIVEYLKIHIDEKVTLNMLTSHFHINRNLLNGIFEEKYQMTCLNYLNKSRIDLAKLSLTQTELPINEIGRRVGFPDNNYFAKVFKKECGMSPSEYRAGQ